MPENRLRRADDVSEKTGKLIHFYNFLLKNGKKELILQGKSII
jgi:hypothetical protein